MNDDFVVGELDPLNAEEILFTIQMKRMIAAIRMMSLTAALMSGPAIRRRGSGILSRPLEKFIWRIEIEESRVGQLRFQRG